ncbi:hypothetical protein AYO21_02946 [Fonsecaea monophora]|uniref:Ubiquitin-like domain-containing protein n=1 Tax=Fonsecaea monophora TaxID=254056 RepID=A0A177FEJ3_9EURO|nr:hypothetical protein AYO21_02946 [Fonsecaea monophora]OAG42663.1 hypothetical protein AYO21_02946 [Fonsecaea monophora]
MPVPFGFSVGDFVAVIQLTGKIISSLKGVGGSASEYQHAVVELESLKRLLEKVTKLTITEDNAVQVNALRGLALACEPCLQEFYQKLRSYEASIGPYAPRGRLKGAFHKVKWAFLGSEEFSQFRKFIAMKVLCLSLLLSMHIFESASTRNSQEHIAHFSLLDEITKLRESMERLELANQQRSSHLDHEASLRPIQDKVEDIAARLESHLTPVSSALTSVGRAVFGFHNVLGQIIDFLGSFRRETKVALQRIIQTNMQIYALLLTSQNSPGHSPSMLSDAILFEDALGRTVSLPYQWFRHWEAFEGLLRAEFKGIPGEAKVLEGQYHLIDTKGGGAIIKKQDWHRTVFPGSSVTMSVIISQIRWQGGLCPRPSCAEPRIDLDHPRALVTCCGLKYYPSRERLEGSTKRVTVLTEDDEVIWSQSTQDLEIFGARPLPRDPEESTAILALLQSTDTPAVDEEISSVHNATQANSYGEKEPTSYEPTGGPDFQKPKVGKTRTSDKLHSEFETPLDNWLAQTESVHLEPNMLSNTPVVDTTRQDEEASEIEHFRQVHIKQWTNDADRNNDKKTGADDLEWGAEIDEAIYHRNICDRFPLIPSYLAHRLARFNLMAWTARALSVIPSAIAFIANRLSGSIAMTGRTKVIDVGAMLATIQTSHTLQTLIRTQLPLTLQKI